MAKPRVLYISNNHPAVYIGGAEVYSYELYKAMEESEECEPIFLARTFTSGYESPRDTPFRSINDNPTEILWSSTDHDDFFSKSPFKEELTIYFDNFLKAYRPNVVHIQHTVGLGVDLIRQIKNSLPGTPIVYTLHEFLPICNAMGLMIRPENGELCDHASPARCHECFPSIAPQQFFLREQFMKSHFDLVNLFLAPSHCLRQRFIDWGIPPEKIRFLDYGRIPQPCVAHEDGDTPPVGHFGFFGQLAPHKGVLVLLKAMKILLDTGIQDVRLFLSGANLERQTDEFREQMEDLLDKCADNVTFLGSYSPHEVLDRMRPVAWSVVPSLWWENSPLVIQEAFMHRRPVICSNIGGMAEKVKHGVNGLHFRVGDAANLAATLRHAASSPDEWQSLRAAISPVYSMAEAVAAHTEIYSRLLGADPEADRQEHP